MARCHCSPRVFPRAEITLVIILGLDSAIGAYYYLRLAAMPFLAEAPGAVPAEAYDLHPRNAPLPRHSRQAAVVLALLAGSQLMEVSAKAGFVDARVNGMDKLQPFKPKLTSVEEGGRPARVPVVWKLRHTDASIGALASLPFHPCRWRVIPFREVCST